MAPVWRRMSTLSYQSVLSTPHKSFQASRGPDTTFLSVRMCQVPPLSDPSGPRALVCLQSLSLPPFFKQLWIQIQIMIFDYYRSQGRSLFNSFWRPKWVLLNRPHHCNNNNQLQTGPWDPSVYPSQCSSPKWPASVLWPFSGTRICQFIASELFPIMFHYFNSDLF